MNNSKIEFIQYFRAIAAIMVVLVHSGGAFGYRDLFVIGGLGVNIFFFVSGFIITYIFIIKKDIEAPEFLKKRCLRIYPTYFQAYALTVVIWVLFRGILKLPVFPRGDFFYNLTLISFVDRTNEFADLPVRVAWTLYYEMIFYLVFALSILIFRKRAVLGIYLFCGWSLLSIKYPFLYSWTLLDPTVNFQFIIGCSVALLIFENKKFFSGALALVSFYAIFSYAESGIMLALYFTALLAILFFILEKNGLFFRSKLLSLIGDSSYSLYLTHALILGLLRLVIKPIFNDFSLVGMWLIVLVTTAICVYVGIYNFKHFERRNKDILVKFLSKIQRMFRNIFIDLK